MIDFYLNLSKTLGRNNKKTKKNNYGNINI